MEAKIIWEEIDTQVISAGMGIAGINYAEYRQACRDLDIYRSRGLDRKIKAIEREMVQHVNTGTQRNGSKKGKAI